MREREREGGGGERAVVQEVREGGGEMRIPDSSAVGG